MANTTTLYQRLGGAQGVARIVDDFVAAHLSNPLIKARFVKTDIDHAKQMAREFISAGTGGPGPYTGRDMLTTHKGMNISEQEFIATIDDILLALDKNGIDEDSKKDVLAILYSLKGDIIRV